MRYTLSLYRDDMGSYKTVCMANGSETVWENGLWDVNHARAHDGLRPLTIEQLQECATLTPINYEY